MAKRDAGGVVAWDTKQLMIQVEELGVDAIDKIALEVGSVSEEPVDTGFLAASFYVASSSGLNTFNEIWDDGEFFSRRSGRRERRTAMPVSESPPEFGALAVWGAAYALWVEERTGFIYRAVQEVARRHRT